VIRLRVRRAIVLLPLFGLLAAGCVDLPANSGVNSVDKQGNAGSGSDVRIWPQGPQKDETAAGIVEGFLQTAASDPSNHSIAEAYLTGPASRNWNWNKVLVFSGDLSSAATVGGSDDLVQITGTLVAVSDSGAYRPVSDAQQQTFRFHLVKDRSKGYQIDRLPGGDFGIALTQEAFRTNYTAYYLYYLNKADSAASMIPVPVYQRSPAGDAATAADLAAALMLGPPDSLEGAAENAVPDAALAPGQTVTISQGGTAIVPLKTPNDCTKHGRSSACVQLADQLMATFGALPSINGVTVVDSAGHALGSSTSLDSVLRQYHVAVSAPRSPSFYYLDAATHRVMYSAGSDGQTVAQVGPDSRKYGQLAISVLSGATAAAVVDLAGANLYVGTPGSVAEPVKKWSGQNISSLSWDAFGRLWFLGTRAGVTGVYELDASGGIQADPRPAAVFGADGVTLRQLAIAPDGRRIAVVYSQPGPNPPSAPLYSLGIGVVDDTGSAPSVDVNFGVAGPVVEQWTNITAVNWHGSQSLAILGNQEPSQPLIIAELNPDGSPVLNSSDFNAVTINPPKGATGIEWTGNTLLASYSTGAQGNPPSSHAIEQYMFPTNTWEVVKGAFGTMPTYVN
jgi:hypothetical protein